MRNDFAAFIVTHGRPDRVHTYETLRQSGYTGKIYLIVDDQDKTLPEYQKRYGDEVIVFSKDEIAPTFDIYDNFGKKNVVVFARNANFVIAKKLGLRFFWQLDDDYTWWQWRFNDKLQQGYFGKICRIDAMLDALIEYFESIPVLSIATSQGGDHIGSLAWRDRGPFLKRKVMNSFLCDTEKPFQFEGYINEDVNTYSARSCPFFFTVMQIQLSQIQTQTNKGGLTDAYLDDGTYVKSFYSIINNPAAVKIAAMGQSHYRIHHRVISDACYPKILSAKHKKQEPKRRSRKNG